MRADLRRIWSEVRAQLGGSSSAPTVAPTVPDAVPGVPPPPGAPVRAGWQNESVLLGAVLVVIGVVFLVNNTGLVNWDVIWPVALVGLGIVLLVRNAQRRP